MNILLVDIGELGWSLNLSAHARWLVKLGHNVAVITSKDRFPLYRGMVHMEPSQTFYTMFGNCHQDGLGLHGIKSESLRDFFKCEFEGYELPDDFTFTCNREFFIGRVMYEPYEARKKILVFPRHREGDHHGKRNLSEKFYKDLIVKLCDTFPQHDIVSVGTMDGAYFIPLDVVFRGNYKNKVGSGGSIQDLINLCDSAVGAVGGTSAPPKITLLQGVPTFIIGHNEEHGGRDRLTKKENWMGTRSGFFEIGEDEYNTFRDPKCIEAICKFLAA